MKELEEIRNDILNFRNFELITKNKELEMLSKLNKIEKQLSIHVVSQRSELFAEQDSKDFILWQRDREIRRLENGKYKWREFEYNREFFLEKYLEDKNKANCG